MSDQLIGQGATVSFSNDAYVADDNVIPCVQTITLPDSEVDEIEAPCIADSIVVKISSRQRDAGQMTVEYAYDPNDAVHQEIETRHKTGEIQTWRLIIQPTASGGSATQLEFSGWIQSVAGSNFGAADLITKSAAITLTSDIVVSPPT